MDSYEVVQAIGLIYFICLILSDNWTALGRKPRTWWIPGNALVLSALSIQVLNKLIYHYIYFSDISNADYVEADLQYLLHNQWMIDSGRLVICVFIGYLLPGMAARGSAEDASSNIVALAVSLFYAIVPELFFVLEKDGSFRRGSKVWFAVSSSLFLVAIVLLLLFLVSAILAGKTVRFLLKQRTKTALLFNKPNEGEDCCKKVENQVLKSWLLCRAGQPEYVIARSVLSSSTGLVVTASILLFVAKTLKLRSPSILHFHDGMDWLRNTILVLQCVFLLLGWWVIFRRWFMGVIYFPVSNYFPWSPVFVEDFWTRSIIELIDMYDLQQWRWGQKPETNRGIFVDIFTKLKLHKLLYIFWVLQKLLVWFSKWCCLLSQILFGSYLIRKALMGNGMNLFYDSSGKNEEFKKYKEALEHVCMPGENPASLWLMNKDSIDQARDRIEEGKKSECPELIELIEKSAAIPREDRFVDKLECLPVVEEYFPTLNENWWKTTAVALLRMILKIEGDMGKKEKAMKAYQQAWDLMTFVENSNSEQLKSIKVTKVFDIEADMVNLSADKEFKKLREMQGSSNNLRTGDASEALADFLNNAKQQLRNQKLLETDEDTEKANGHICEGPHDSKDWNEIVPSYNMYRVCKKLQSPSAEFYVNDLHVFLGDVIADSVEQLLKFLVTNIGEWAAEQEEENMWEALQIAGKCMKVMDNSNIGAKVLERLGLKKV